MRFRRKQIVVAMLTVSCLMLIGTWLLARSSGRPAGLGVHEGRLAPCPVTPNCVCTQGDDQDHWIAPFALRRPETDSEESIDAVAEFQRLKSMVLSWPRTTLVTDRENYVHVEFRSPVFGFVDDVEFQLDTDAGMIHFRSASRVGRSDLGVNRRRMEAIRQQFERP